MFFYQKIRLKNLSYRPLFHTLGINCNLLAICEIIYTKFIVDLYTLFSLRLK